MPSPDPPQGPQAFSRDAWSRPPPTRPSLRALSSRVTRVVLGTLLMVRVVPAQEPDAGPALPLVQSYLEARDEAGRSEAMGAIRVAGLSFDEVRAAAGRLVALPGSPREAGTHRLEIAVALPGAPPVPCLLRLPPGYDGQTPLPLLIAMHGTGGSAEDMLACWGSVADAAGLVLACPQATRNRFKGWGSTALERASLLAVLREIRLRFAVHPDQVGLTGISMGGHASWEMGMLYPDEAAALFPVCGGPRKEMVPLVANLVGGPLLWQCQGGQDQSELVRAVTMGIERLQRLGGEPILELDPARGHTFFPHLREARLEALRQARRPDRPARVEGYVLGPPWPRLGWVRVEALTPEAYRTDQQLELVFRGKTPTEEEKFLKLWEEVEERLARVEAWTRRAKILLRTRHVQRVTILLDATLIDLSRPLQVKQGGKLLWSGRLQPDIQVLLEELARTGDRRRLVVARVTVDLPVQRRRSDER